ncbi:hypothetical protein THAOC_06428 [Thalassiosira oceanica]|uniref:Uncharacterized protein n=1 Tax=Thalassiosira oceanica TaxID=159749 RepID=K0TLR5_THAOC|nr:hypothetical protein THAOC_06428 [Thalassiosira oceanica]|eukprot:EJK72077.1 hypothetical protein THAOC_06428 [Thalassiosira oceanica]
MAAHKRGMDGCAFCRTPCPINDADALAMIQTRVAKRDPAAIYYLGQQYFFGQLGLQEDSRKGVELYTEAVELDSIQALFDLGHVYYHGDGVQEDKAKAAEFWTKAAMQGHVESRHNLGWLEGQKGNRHRAYAEALKGHQDAVEEMKSHDRDEAKAYLDSRK